MHILNASHQCASCKAGWLRGSSACWKCGGKGSSFALDTQHANGVLGSLTFTVSGKPDGDAASQLSEDLEKLGEILSGLYP